MEELNHALREAQRKTKSRGEKQMRFAFYSQPRLRYVMNKHVQVCHVLLAVQHAFG